MRLIGRGGYDWTKRYPWIAEAARKATDVVATASKAKGRLRHCPASFRSTLRRGRASHLPVKTNICANIHANANANTTPDGGADADVLEMITAEASTRIANFNFMI